MAKIKKSHGGWRLKVIVIFMMLTGLVFLPTSIILIVGMLPTLVATLLDTHPEKTKGVTVGAMNLAGCAPFVIQLWKSGQSPEHAMQVIFDPFAIVVIYAAAAVGYLIDWSLTGIVSSFLSQRGRARLNDINAQQKQLVERWGQEVTGEIPLDAQGFPLVAPGSAGE